MGWRGSSPDGCLLMGQSEPRSGILQPRRGAKRLVQWRSCLLGADAVGEYGDITASSDAAVSHLDKPPTGVDGWMGPDVVTLKYPVWIGQNHDRARGQSGPGAIATTGPELLFQLPKLVILLP